MAGTAQLYAPTVGSSGNNGASWVKDYVNRDGFDLVWRQRYLQDQMAKIEDDIRAIELNANLSDTEKMFSMQMAMNTWSAVSNLRTNMLKSVSDTLKSIARNVA
ncbi:EscF/YscF/HrpA family type III secretion system needle major subunit [Prosthecomicrobium sp. N25]|uniref:EscF/YscF/HrpA family type III secretion system needle major subunit n=1 Tax=Prosthecomicrobium sp. N25 TaxID=3129254 RepID=UPI003077CB0B